MPRAACDPPRPPEPFHPVEGDWLEFVRRIPAGTVDMIYADPPFFTGATQRSSPAAARRHRTADASYADSWPGVDGYIGWLRERIEATAPALKPTGLILIHCDWHACHHIRLMLEELFGVSGFVNHLIWSYGLGGSSPRRFARKHDDILVYAADSRRAYFDPPMVPATSARMKGKLKKATDVIDIPSLNNMAAERSGYPTQKPLQLLSLLIRAFCPPGGTVLDPCFGSGTTLLAAKETGRLGIGCDVNPQAVRICRERLSERETGPTPARLG